MKKVVINISDSEYEKFRFESIHEKKPIPELIKERIFHKPFDLCVIEAYEAFVGKEMEVILNED